MAKSIFDDAARQQLLARLARLQPTSARRFGKMTPSQMVCHLADSMRCAVGETPTRAHKTFLSSPVMRWLILYVMPWPKGKVETAREMQLTQPGEFEADRQQLADMLTRTAQRGPQAAWAVHPAFGAMSGRDYGVLIHRHCDHHFRQFGI